MRLLIILIFIAMARIGSGQNTDSLYTEDELKVFVRVTILSHNHGINQDSIARAAALRSGISMERLGDIIRAGIDGKSKQITEAEKSALAAFEEANAIIREKRIVHIKSVCQGAGLPYEKYQAMNDLFRKSIPFQQRLVPYFKAEIEK